MKLYLVQHGEANPENIDPEKRLSEQGQRDVHKVGQVLKQAHITINEIWHSGKARAQQTAQLLAEQMNPQVKILNKENLNPNDSITPVQNELASRSEDLMVVGHLPFLDKLASALLTGNEKADIVNFQQGGMILLEKTAVGWQIQWFVIPELI